MPHRFHEEKDFQGNRGKKGERGFWQRRFGKHVIRDERDYEGHVDYLHDNPVKQGQVMRVANWRYSSFHRYGRCGIFNLEREADADVRRPETE